MDTKRTIEEIRANPFIGDIVVLTTLKIQPQQITEFEVWNGWRWVPAAESAITIYIAQK